MSETKRFRWPELTMGETFTGKEDAYNHRREYVLASEYDTLRECYDGILDAGNKAIAERDELRAKLAALESPRPLEQREHFNCPTCRCQGPPP